MSKYDEVDGIADGECTASMAVVLETSLRRQDSEQYRMLPPGVTICLSQVALNRSSLAMLGKMEANMVLPELDETRHAGLILVLAHYLSLGSLRSAEHGATAGVIRAVVALLPPLGGCGTLRP